MRRCHIARAMVVVVVAVSGIGASSSGRGGGGGGGGVLAACRNVSREWTAEHDTSRQDRGCSSAAEAEPSPVGAGYGELARVGGSRKE